MASSSRLRIGVLVDRRLLAHWQVDALRTLGDDVDLLVYSCLNTLPSRRKARFALYYLLNLFSVRNRMTRRALWPSDLIAVESRDFKAIQEGGWQSLPPDLIELFRTDGIALIVKFGMGLLQVPNVEELPIPILSYHHGDPAEFRGRPAGFYELQSGKPVMGQVVQRITNDLDAGEILASAETRVFAHSYRKTLVEAYRHSPLILKRAVESALMGRASKPERLGRNHRLPANGQVLRLLLKLSRAAAMRIGYGLFQEKRWQVATTAISRSAPISTLQQAISDTAFWQTPPVPKGFRFLADPFFHPDQGLLVEGMNTGSCRGEILHVGNHGVRELSLRGGHYSYPAHIRDGENLFVVPESSDWSPAQAFLLGEEGLGEPFELKIPGRPALLDPTPFWHGGSLFLFGNRADEGSSVLRLWIAEDLHKDFVEHPDSPIRLSPNGSRMGGSLFNLGGQLYRTGQDLRGSYGDGITLFRVVRIDRESYCETAERHLRFDHVRGPHTLNFGQGRAAFDYYTDRFHLFAGLRRLRERQAARRMR
jgi:hypothetical protein